MPATAFQKGVRISPRKVAVVADFDAVAERCVPARLDVSQNRRAMIE